MRAIIILISLAALALALAIAAAGPATRIGLWEFGTGLALIRKLALPVMIGAGLAAVAFALALFAARGLAPLALAATIAAVAAAFVPIKMRADFRANPFIHDITTDFDDPPPILAAADMERANPSEYRGGDPVPQSEGVTVAAAQRRAFPDIAPILVSRSLEQASAAAKETIEKMGMDILAEGPAGADPGAGWRIEAVATSLWFGFNDDFVVRLRPEGEATRIDVRSKSRFGGSDLGANARRVREFMEQMDG